MTREEKVNLLKAIIQECEEYQWWRKATLSEIIEDLEQEPFINKPCVSAGVCEHDKIQMLDNLRAEIGRCGSIMVAYAITKDTKTNKGIEDLVKGVVQQAKEQVLEIIDKYRTESEND